MIIWDLFKVNDKLKQNMPENDIGSKRPVELSDLNVSLVI